MKTDQHILILVEDFEIQVFLSTVLSEASFQPVIAEGIDDAFEKIITQKPLLIIIDMMIPRQLGIKMYRQLKTHDKYKNLPVIMLSSLEKKAFYKFQNIEYTLPHKGLPKPEGYLPKTLEAEDLLSTVNKIKNRSKGKNRCH